MNLTEAMKGRHSVRQYTDQPLNEAVISALQKEIDRDLAEKESYGLYRNDWKERSHPG